MYTVAEEMKRCKESYGYTYEQLEEITGVSKAAIRKALNGRTKQPRRATIAALRQVLTRFFPDQEDLQHGLFGMEDYMALPDRRRVEMIDGVFYEMEEPIRVHQVMREGIVAALTDQLREQDMSWVIPAADAEVQPDEDGLTVVRPDMFMVCDGSGLADGRYAGPPDFVIEIMSSLTRHKDMQVKRRKYAAAGVREYWLADVTARSVMVLTFGENEAAHLFGMDETVPVGISEGRLKVDFGDILRQMQVFFKI